MKLLRPTIQTLTLIALLGCAVQPHEQFNRITPALSLQMPNYSEAQDHQAVSSRAALSNEPTNESTVKSALSLANSIGKMKAALVICGFDDSTMKKIEARRLCELTKLVGWDQHHRIISAAVDGEVLFSEKYPNSSDVNCTIARKAEIFFRPIEF